MSFDIDFTGRKLTLFFCTVSVLTVVFASLEKSPKILTKEGNVVLEAGINRNITIRLNGRSRLLINDLDLMDLLLGERRWITNNASLLPVDGVNLRILQDDVNTLRSMLIGNRGFSARIRSLQNRTRISNPTNLLRRTQRRVSSLENRFQALVRTLQVDECKSNPCENGGSCTDLYDGFMCKCVKGFEGSTCTTDVNECALFAGTDIGCQNGAQCINQFGSYSCICNAGWQGIHCNQRKTDCLHSSNLELCGHGTCINANDNFGYRCICEQGWKSNGLTPSCSVDVDECKEYSNPCSNKCTNLPGGFMCAPCDAGYTGNGLSCRDIDECATDNGGCSVMPFVPCINTYGSFHCGECPVGWVGDGRICTRNAGQSCARNNICHSVALCQEVSNRIVCSCPVGMTGNGVGPNGCSTSGRNLCSSSPCLNGGTCMDTGNGSFTCLCPIGFRLPNCIRNFNPCASNPCLNGGTCRPQQNSFTCACAAGYGGRLCDSQRSRCGQYISSEHGNLKYPLVNMYNHNSQCSWVIRTDDAKVLNITFTKFEIEDSIECRFDWLQMHDGPTAASQLIGRFCGSMAPLGGNIITTTNRIYLWFKSDNSTAKAGFDMTWSSIDPVCGGIVEFDSHTTIASPGSPGNYPRNRDCKWHLKVPNTKRIKLVFFTLQIEKHSNCNHDFLEITDAISDSRLEIFCNSSNPAPFTVPSNEIIVHFHSDNEGADLGFQIHASTVERIPGCGGTYTEREGEIVSPSGFDGSMSCEYTVRYPIGIRVRLFMSEFKMGDDDCIEIFNVNAGTKASTGRWCGKMNVPEFKSITNEVQINYYSKGGTFRMSYGTICEYFFEENSGVITSPNYPSPYPSSETCTYEIRGESNHVVSLEFVDMDLEAHEGINTCWFDYISIIDGSNETAGGPYCGRAIPPKIISSTSFLKIILTTDRDQTGRGFKANYTLIETGIQCGGVMSKASGEIRLPSDSASGLYQHDLSCIWTIIAPTGYAIQLTWLSFRLEDATDCLYDFIKIYNTDKIESEQSASRRFCGSTAPPAIVSAGNIMTIQFKSDSTDAESGFVAKYNFVDASTLCGGVIFSSNGKITSPRWLSDYPNDLNCTWVLSVPNGHQLELIIKAMDLETSEDCNNDWLEIRNGGSASSPLVGKYCGQTIPNRVTSFTNQMHINFKTNSQVVKTGFLIEWQTISSGCGGTLTTDHGSVASPFYPEYYSNDAQCEWRLSVNKGSTISIKFEDISLESLMSCTYDYVEVYDGATATARKLGQYCEMPEGSANLIQTTGSDALIRFQSDASNTDRGFYLTYMSNCNQNISAMQGAIESPNFGQNNPSDVNCTWTINAPKRGQIAMNFAIVGQKESDLKSEYVYVKDNGTVLRITQPQRFVSKGDNVQIVLNSSSIYFRMEFALRGCVENFHRASGEFTSPKYPNAYPDNTGCLWRIEIEFGKAIELVFTNVDLEASENCTNDAIRVMNEGNHLLGTFCGKRDNITVTSTAHILIVQFFSNYHIGGRGFTAKYSTIETKCGGKYNLPQGTIHSPNYPARYDSDSYCEWEIQVADHSTMNITVEELDIEESYHCLLDSLKIYDGNATDVGDPWLNLCDQIPSVNVFRTTSNVAKLVFSTDSDTELKGFKVSFKENCGKRFVVAPGSSGRIRFGGSDQAECRWIIAAEDNSKHVTFTITHIQMTLLSLWNITNDDCDGVLVFEGDLTSTVGFRPRRRICSHHPPAVTSLGHVLTIQLDPKLISELDGFYTTMDNNCGGKYYSQSGLFASPSYPLSYPVNIECIWEIVANDGNALSLTIQRMDIDKTEHCNADYLEVREGSGTGRLLGVFCGGEIPETLIAQKAMWIKFYSDNDYVRRGFMAEYSYAITTELNGTGGIIESPKYPKLFTSTTEHGWRISVPRGELIMLTIEYFSELYANFIAFYNGYDDQAERIEYTNSNLIRSDTNILYIKSSRGVFRFHWHKVSKQFMADNNTAALPNSICPTQTVTAGDFTTNLHSPGFPHGYASDLNCSWIIVPQNPAYHAELAFVVVDLEDDRTCASDRVIIYSSIDMTNWKQLDKICKVKADSVSTFSGDKFLKVEFVSDYSINKTGFSALASSSCGSTLTDPSGFVNITGLGTRSFLSQHSCVWKIHVKTGRRIKITFIESQMNIINESSGHCRSYVLLKNGISEHSPNLGTGKYCDGNLPDVPITASNEAYVKLVIDRLSVVSRPRISFKYEEVMNECSHNINLENKLSSVDIHSENYPNIPHAHTMCVWIVKAPVDRRIAVDFTDLMDLKQTDLCDVEYIELHDGATDLSPVIGRFCGKSIPNTQFSSGNYLRMTYFTDIAEPHIGFKAKVSLGMCGGTYRMRSGNISTPLALTVKNGLSCDYIISLDERYVVNVTVNSLSLPWSGNCSEVNHLSFTPIYIDEEVEVKPTVLCGNSERETYFFETNKVLIRYQVTNKDDTSSFKLTYSGVSHQCGRTIEAESGILKSPGYLFPINYPTRCIWKIKVPKGRRIKVEFLDYNIVDTALANTTSRRSFRLPVRLVLANDFEFKSVIERIWDNPPAALYSSDNLLAVLSIERPAAQKQGFKMRFSSEGESLYCNENFDKVQGDAHFQPPQNTSIYCRYDISVRQNETIALTVSSIEARTTVFRDYYYCMRHGPISIQNLSGNRRTTWFCGNRNETTIRLPYPVMLDIFNNFYNEMVSLDLKFARHNCGGVFVIGNEFQIREPSTLTVNYGAMDCVWQVLPNPGDLEHFVISLNVDFQLKCDEQYLILYEDSTKNSPHLGRYCNQATESNLISTKDLIIEYHTANFELGSTFNLTATVGTGCGGILTYPYRLIDFRTQYQNNVECIWTIRSSKEYHIGLRFSGRFFIESSANCTKDYILVQEEVGIDEWNNIQRICGREPPAFVNSTTNVMRFIFRSDDSGTADGFTAQFERNCGGSFHADKDFQTLSSPNYPLPYDYNLTCNYTIIPSDPNRSILLQITDFMLEDSPTGNCEFDSLTVSIPYQDPTVLCGKSADFEFRSTYPIKLLFKSDASTSRKGFLLRFGDEMCGGTITSSTTIATPKQKIDDKYPSNTVCFWNITAAEGSKIVIKFERFEFEGSMACNYDYVQVFSGKLPVEDQRIAKLCGKLTGKLPTLTIKSNLGIIQSVSDQSEPSMGFSALVSIVKNCDRDIELKDASDQYTLSDFATGYEDNLHCEFLFQAKPGNQLVLEFTSFHVEEALNCDNDYVQILDGSGPFADEIGKFCGHTIPNRVMSSRATMFVRFVSDSSDSSSGFSATVKVSPLVCGPHELNIMENKSTVITSGEGSTYQPNLNCFWHISAENNIHLEFEKLDIQGPDENGTCTTDYLKIYNRQPFSVVENAVKSDIVFNGDVSPYENMFDSEAPEHVFCGQGAPEGYYTNNQDVYIKFFTDSTIEKSGFKIIATSMIGCIKNFTATQGRIFMRSSEDCNIYINSPANYSITIYFNYFYFFYGDSAECKSDFIEIFDERANSTSVGSTSISKICGSVNPSNSVFSDSNKLRISLSNRGLFNSYDMSFLASDKGPGCGGDFYNSAGVFTSPFYPVNARNNSDCRWNIRVPNNLAVFLEFKIFDLGSKVTCRSDYLQILEQGPGNADEVTRQFCGEDTPTMYIGRRNILSVRFRKTVNFDGTGWVIRYSGVRRGFIPALI